ncbi:MAG: hypothetical protein H0X52_09510 [Gemmatimonadetes bacterium]|jgi:hypothetical protein|nr:hypothetical protein [Gemmatimonadota bacterium]
MTVKERLHHLVDVLPERELETAARVLEALHATADPVAWALDNAPLDDEPYTQEEQAAVEEAYEDVASGTTFTLDEVKRELGL